jgi:hypothetical protein
MGTDSFMTPPSQSESNYQISQKNKPFFGYYETKERPADVFFKRKSNQSDPTTSFSATHDRHLNNLNASKKAINCDEYQPGRQMAIPPALRAELSP